MLDWCIRKHLNFFLTGTYLFALWYIPRILLTFGYFFLSWLMDNIIFLFTDQNIWAQICDFQQCGVLKRVDSDEPVQPPLKLRNSKWCLASSLTVIEYLSDSKGSDQYARMRRLVWAFAVRTYHIVGNLMSLLNYVKTVAYLNLSACI